MIMYMQRKHRQSPRKKNGERLQRKIHVEDIVARAHLKKVSFRVERKIQFAKYQKQKFHRAGYVTMLMDIWWICSVVKW